MAEEAKRISEEVKTEADSSGASQDTFVERLVKLNFYYLDLYR